MPVRWLKVNINKAIGTIRQARRPAATTKLTSLSVFKVSNRSCADSG